MNNLLVTALLLGTVLSSSLLILLLFRVRSSKIFADDVRSDLRLGRDEARTAAKDTRDDVARTLRSMNETLRDQNALQQNHFTGLAVQLKEFSDFSQIAAESLRAVLDGRGKDIQTANESKLDEIRRTLELVRNSIDKRLQTNSDASVTTLDRMTSMLIARLDAMAIQVKDLSEATHNTLDRVRTTFDCRIQDLQSANDRKFDEARTGLADSLRLFSGSLDKNVETASSAQHMQLDAMTGQLKQLSQDNQAGLDRIRQSLEVSIREMREGNEQKLEQMRNTVDEKLQDTLEKRLGESFKFVSERLELVHKGLGEMQSLATGVGDLKRVLTNVKVRGTLAEVQLGAILEQMLTPDQWAKNVIVKEGSLERVEFAIRLPGPKDDPTQCMWLPIDSKFPKEDFVRLQTAAEAGDSTAVQAASDALVRALRVAAKEIQDKYINSPATTDYAIMFLATEGLYAEALRQPQFVEELLQRYRVLVAGPMTLSAVLSSLRMGFQTLMVEQRAVEVWRVLGAVKTEFGKFGNVLDKVQRQLQTASKTIEETGTRTRVMERKLRSVGQLDAAETATILALPASAWLDSDAENEDGASNVVRDATPDLRSTGTDTQ